MDQEGEVLLNGKEDIENLSDKENVPCDISLSLGQNIDKNKEIAEELHEECIKDYNDLKLETVENTTNVVKHVDIVVEALVIQNNGQVDKLNGEDKIVLQADPIKNNSEMQELTKENVITPTIEENSVNSEVEGLDEESINRPTCDVEENNVNVNGKEIDGENIIIQPPTIEENNVNDTEEELAEENNSQTPTKELNDVNGQNVKLPGKRDIISLTPIIEQSETYSRFRSRPPLRSNKLDSSFSVKSEPSSPSEVCFNKLYRPTGNLLLSEPESRKRPRMEVTPDNSPTNKIIKQSLFGRVKSWFMADD